MSEACSVSLDLATGLCGIAVLRGAIDTTAVRVRNLLYQAALFLMRAMGRRCRPGAGLRTQTTPCTTLRFET